MTPSTVGRGLCLPVYRTTLPVKSVYPAACGNTVIASRARLSTTVAMRSPKSQAAMATTTSLIHSSSSSSSSPSTTSSASLSRRHISSSERRPITLADDPATMPPLPPSFAEASSRAGPLSVLPLSMIIRSLLTNTVSASPTLLPPSLRIMGALASTQNPILSPDRNPLLRFFLKHTFYAQFCAGENSVEVRRTVQNLREIGFTGVILAYAKEVVLTDAQTKALAAAGNEGEETEECIRNELKPWAEGTMETVRLTSEGDFVGLKFTGAGRLALYQLRNRLPCSPYLAESVDAICQLAQERGVRLLFDAEQDALQDGIDDWTMQYSRKYNKDPEKPVIYGTYQAYKKNMPEVISAHLAEAQKEGFTLGVKLVRGAYLGSDPRHRLHDTKEDTDVCYNSIAASVLTRQWNATVTGEGAFPPAALVLATHNAESVRRARAICDAGLARSHVAFAQLQGMADEVSCELVEAGSQSRAGAASSPSVAASTLPAYKYLVWGSTGECMKYLLRRAHENKDAVSRTQSGRDAMWAELVRRFKVATGLAA